MLGGVPVEERDAEVAEAVARMCDVGPVGVQDSQGQAEVAEGRWSRSVDARTSWTSPRAPARDQFPTPQYLGPGWVQAHPPHRPLLDALFHVHDPCQLHVQTVCDYWACS